MSHITAVIAVKKAVNHSDNVRSIPQATARQIVVMILVFNAGFSVAFNAGINAIAKNTEHPIRTKSCHIIIKDPFHMLTILLSFHINHQNPPHSEQQAINPGGVGGVTITFMAMYLVDSAL
jgi:hypothetical protein